MISIVFGRLGKDPEVKFSVNGKMYVNFSVAESNYVKGEYITTWHNARAWGKRAEYIGNNFSKGEVIYIEGESMQSKSADSEKVFKFIEVSKVKRAQPKNQQTA